MVCFDIWMYCCIGELFLSLLRAQQKRRRPRVVYLQFEAFALPKGSNKQQETYADMTNRLAKIQQSRCIVTPIGIYCSL